MHLQGVPETFLYLLGTIAIAALAAGTALAITGYSSAGPFSIAAAIVGVLGTLATRPGEQPPPAPTLPPETEP